MAKPPLGSGQRFAALQYKLSNQPGVTDPRALAAAIGNKRYGPAQMQRLATRGRKRRRVRKSP